MNTVNRVTGQHKKNYRTVISTQQERREEKNERVIAKIITASADTSAHTLLAQWSTDKAASTLPKPATDDRYNQPPRL